MDQPAAGQSDAEQAGAARATDRRTHHVCFTTSARLSFMRTYDPAKLPKDLVD